MSHYRFVRFPGKNFQYRIAKDHSIITKLSHILNFYTDPKYPSWIIGRLLKTVFDNKLFYSLFGIIGFLGVFLLVLEVSSPTLVFGLLVCEVFIGILLVLYFQNVYDYKALNTTIAFLSPSKLQFHAKKMNAALAKDKREKRKNL